MQVVQSLAAAVVPCMRILLSAYSCEPHRGSEPGLGWNTTIELARNHEVWVITKERHRKAIEQELRTNHSNECISSTTICRLRSNG